MGSEIKASICITSYNADKYIAATIESALNQKTNFDFEILIADDMSADNSRTIIAAYAKKFPDKITAYYNEKNIGPAANLVNLINMAHGEYISELNCDDVYSSELRLQKLVDFLDQRNDYSACISNYCLIDSEGKVTKEKVLDGSYKHMETDYFLGKAVLGGAGIWRRNVLPNPLPEWLKKAGGAIDRALLVAATAGYKIGYLPEVLMSNRLHPKNLGKLQSLEKSSEVDILLNKHFKNLYHKIDPKYDKVFQFGVAYYGYKLSYLKLARGRVFSFLYYFCRAFLAFPVISPDTQKDILYAASPELFYKLKALFPFKKTKQK